MYQDSNVWIKFSKKFWNRLSSLIYIYYLISSCLFMKWIIGASIQQVMYVHSISLGIRLALIRSQWNFIYISKNEFEEHFIRYNFSIFGLFYIIFFYRKNCNLEKVNKFQPIIWKWFWNLKKNFP